MNLKKVLINNIIFAVYLSLSVFFLSSCYSCKRNCPNSGIHWNTESVSTMFKSVSEKEYWYPRFLELNTGQLICVFDTKIKDLDNKVMVAENINGTEKWKLLSTASFGNGDAANGHLIQLKNGHLLLAYRLINDSFKSIKVSISKDKAKTWKHLSTIITNSEGVWEPFMLQNPDDEILIFYANEKYRNSSPVYPQVIEMRRSYDNAQSWSPPVLVTAFEHSREGMPAVARLNDGTIMTVFEANCPPHPLVLMSVISKDNGNTWTPRKILYKPDKPGKRAAAPFLINTKNGRLFLSFQTDEDKLKTGELFCEMKVLESRDLGKTWGHKTKPFCVNKGFALWNTLIELPENQILAASSINKNYKGSEIKIIKGKIIRFDIQRPK